MSELSAYEKMLKDGSAFKRINMQKIQNQQYARAGMGGHDNDVHSGQSSPLGESTVGSQLEDDHTDFSAVDEAMQRRINALKEKMNSKPQVRHPVPMLSTEMATGGTEDIVKLKRRVKQLEEAVMLLMKTQSKLLG